jgi:cytochrome P450
MPHVVTEITTTGTREIPRFTGSARELVRAPHLFFLKLTQDYGDIVQYRAAPEPAYLINHPAYIQHVLLNNGKNYNKDTHLNKYMLQSVTGEGLITSENPLWRKQRHLMQPAFHRHNLVNFADLIGDATNRMLEQWVPYAVAAEPFNIAEEMMKLTLNIVTRALFGYNISAEAEKVGAAVDQLIAYRKPNRPGFKEVLQVLDDIVFNIIDQRRQSGPSARGDLLDMLLEARYEDGGGMDDKQVRDEVISLLIAGHETTATTLTWMWYLLCQNPAAVDEVQAEVDQVLAGRLPTASDFPRLTYGEKVIKEGLRLYPSAWSISRSALEADNIDGYDIPARSIVALSPYTMHRHPDFWPDPERFDPERFSPEAEAGRHKYAYIPFGGGARKCIGDQLALMESMIILPMVLQRYRLHLVPGHKVVGDALITLRPKHGIMVTATANESI